MNFTKIFLLTAFFFIVVNASFSQARIQIIHNSADAAAEFVDVWLDQTLLVDNFKFRTSTAFMDAPAGTQFTIAITGPDSQDPGNPLWSQTYTLTDGEAYILVAEGIVSPSGYDPAIPFDVAVFTGARETGSLPDVTDMLAHHGSTDSPIVDIYETAIGIGQLVDNLPYAGFDGYMELPINNFIFEVRDEAGVEVIKAYSASFLDMNLKGKAITLVLSGFMHPENNSNGPAFGLYVAPAEGGDLLELREYDPKAIVQLIHNSADAAAAVVDVWLDDALWLDNLAFRTASQFLEVGAENDFTIAVTGPDSPDPGDPLWSGNFNLEASQKYVLVADGIISGSGYDPATPFDIEVYPGAREEATQQEITDMLVHHGTTDAPIIDIYEVEIGLGLLVNNLNYSEFTNYIELLPQDYIFEVRDESGSNKIAAFRAPFETMGLAGSAVTVVASGFLDPGSNSNGPAFGLWMASAGGGDLIELPVYDPKARVQVIHNCADAAASVVDIWLNDDLILDNFAFRTASPFINTPAIEEFTIAVTGPDSQNPSDPLWSQNYTLTEDGTYILVAEGIISDSGYEPATPFSIAVFPNAREEANNSGQTDLLMHHGSTDTPTIDIVEVGIGLGLMADNLSYGQFAGYFGLATVNYIFQVRDENGLTKIAAYQVPLQNMGLEGDAVSVIASGFLAPENNSDGPEFGLYMAQASGGPLVKLPEYAPKAKVQVIHNSADTIAEVVDVWMNDVLIADNLAFRSATAFLDVPAIEQVTLAVKGPDSQDPYGPMFMKNYTLVEGETYIMVAEGILSQAGFEPPVEFDVALYTGAQEAANIVGRTDILVHHGSTDAPMVDIIEVGLGAGVLVTDLEYAEFSSYLELPTIDYILEVRASSDDDLLGTFRAPLQTAGLENLAITVVASGFIDPAVNSDGAPFGLWAAIPEGGPMIELPQYVPSALVQLIHNSADASASVVDVWLDDELLLDDFAFRTATPFTYIPANTQITLAVCASDSQDPGTPLWSQNYTLVEDEIYIMVADGIISSEGYDPLTPFTLHVYTGASIEAGIETNIDMLMFHGSTDLEGVDIDIHNLTTGLTQETIEGLAYGAADGYFALPANKYNLTISNESIGAARAFEAHLDDMNIQGQTLTIIASGFLDPGVNSNGPALGLLAVKVDGTSVMLTDVTGIDDFPITASSFTIYPNPAINQVNIAFELRSKENISMEIMDLTGRLVKSLNLGTKNAGVYNEKMNIQDLNQGMYLLNIRTLDNVISKKIFKN